MRLLYSLLVCPEVETISGYITMSSFAIIARNSDFLTLKGGMPCEKNILFIFANEFP